MATQIEFVSNIDGRDLVPVRYSVWKTLSEVVRTFKRAGYEVVGNIQSVNRKFVGEYVATSRDEKVSFQVVNV